MAKMTASEKKERAEAQAWLRENGLMRPPKKPINKKKVIEEAKEAYGRFDTFGDWRYIEWGIGEMLGHHDYHGAGKSVISDQAVGVAKAILLAERRKALGQRRRAEGTEKSITVGDVYEAVKDIYEM